MEGERKREILFWGDLTTTKTRSAIERLEFTRWSSTSMSKKKINQRLFPCSKIILTWSLGCCCCCCAAAADAASARRSQWLPSVARFIVRPTVLCPSPSLAAGKKRRKKREKSRRSLARSTSQESGCACACFPPRNGPVLGAWGQNRASINQSSSERRERRRLGSSAGVKRGGDLAFPFATLGDDELCEGESPRPRSVRSYASFREEAREGDVQDTENAREARCRRSQRRESTARRAR